MLRLENGSLLHASPGDLRPEGVLHPLKEATTTPAVSPEATLTALTMQPLSSSERDMLSFRLRAATFVLAGAWCIKLSLGAVQTPAAADSSPAADSPPVGGRTCRFLKMSTSSGMVTWGSKPQGKAVRADAESLSNGLSKHERACSLRIVLQVSFQYLSPYSPPHTSHSNSPPPPPPPPLQAHLLPTTNPAPPATDSPLTRANAQGERPLGCRMQCTPRWTLLLRPTTTT